MPTMPRLDLASNPRTLALPALAVVFLVIAGAAAALSSFDGGPGDGSPAVGAAATTPGEGVLGELNPPSTTPSAVPPSGVAPSVAAPSATATSAAAPSAPAPSATPGAAVGFDLARIGPLASTDEPVQVIAGSPQVAARPSEFDRSVRLEGAESQGFCVLGTGVPATQAAVSLELNQERPAPSGRLAVSVIPEAGTNAAVVIPLSLLADIAPDRWYRVTIEWEGDSSVRVTVDDAVTGERVVERDLEPADSAPDGPTDAACVVAASLDRGSALFVDDLMVSNVNSSGP